MILDNNLELRNQQAVDKANKSYERLNTVWTKIENSIKSGVLAPVEFNYKSDSDNTYWIGIQKLSSKWRICHSISKNHSKKTWTSILNSPLEVRLEALNHVPNLIEHLVINNETVVEYLENSVIEAEKFLEENSENAV